MYERLTIANVKSTLFPEGPVSRKVALFQVHTAIYIAFGLFFFLMNLLAGIGTLWFFWPMIGYSPIITTHAAVTYFASLRSGGQDPSATYGFRHMPAHVPTAKPRAVAPAPTQNLSVLREGQAQLRSLRATTMRIPNPVVRADALTLCNVCESVLAAIADHPDEQDVARDFTTRFLTPANYILRTYADLASRDVASARPVLERVEREDIPIMLESARDVYDRLHRRSVIDLEVSREMLHADLTGPGRIGGVRPTAQAS